MTDLEKMEVAVEELIELFEITTPPIPIESMLQRPRANMWSEVDITKLSSSFIRADGIYSPRMSLARMLTRHLVTSDWGKSRGLYDIVTDPDELYTFARMLIMPRNMILQLSSAARTPSAMSIHFQVPEDDAKIRLIQINS